MAECPAQIPAEEGQTQGPGYCKDGVTAHVDFRRKYSQGIRDACYKKCHKSKKGDSKKLWRVLSTTDVRTDRGSTYDNECPWYVNSLGKQVVAEENEHAGNNDG